MSNEDGAKGPKNKPTGDYDVGYCRAPKETRFKKGSSGNPSGRGKPKGKRLVAALVRAELEKTISISANGREERVTMLEAAVRRQINDLLSATPAQRHRAFNRLLELGLLNPSPQDMGHSAEARHGFLEQLARKSGAYDRDPTSADD